MFWNLVALVLASNCGKGLVVTRFVTKRKFEVGWSELEPKIFL